MKLWHKQLLWVLGGLLAIPAIPIVFIAFMLFVFYPLKHKVHVAQADRANERAWETVEATTATISFDVTSDGITRTLSADLICYQGETAAPWSLKGGSPKRGSSRRMEGPLALEAKLPNDATVMIEYGDLCYHLHSDDPNLADALQFADIHVVNSPETRSCRGRLGDGWRAPTLTVSPARIGPIGASLLREQIPKDALASSAATRANVFWQRYENNLRRPIWRSDQQCWIGDGGVCDPELTAVCAARAP